MSVIKIHQYSLLGFVAVSLLTACGSDTLEVNTSFSNTHDVQEGAPVYFNNKVVGQVSEVELLGDGVQLQLSLDKMVANSIGSGSAVVVNRLKEGAPLEIYNRTMAGGALENGQTVKGLNSMLELGTWMLADVIQLGSGAVSEYIEAFQNYLQSDKFRQDKEQARAQIDSAKMTVQEVIRNVESELAEAAENLAGSEEAAAQAVEQLGEELAPVVEEMASGSAQLIEQLQQFALRLEQIEPDQQQAGQQFLTSLLATLEKLNKSIEQGSEKKSVTTEKNQ